MSVMEAKIIFKNLKGFPEFNETNQIRTDLFLDAAKEIVSIIESFGTIFSPIVSDMNGNIEKLRMSYQSNVEKHYYLDNFIKETCYKKNDCTGSSLLWLKRALELLLEFFINILNDNSKSENLKSFFKDAYEKTLKQYHGLIVQATFLLVYNWLPTRSQLFGVDNVYNENMKTMSPFLNLMQNNLKQIDILLKSFNVN